MLGWFTTPLTPQHAPPLPAPSTACPLLCLRPPLPALSTACPLAPSSPLTDPSLSLCLCACMHNAHAPLPHHLAWTWRCYRPPPSPQRDARRPSASLAMPAAQFVPPTPCRSVALWDVNQSHASRDEPRRIAKCSPHSKGIFSLHELGGHVVTGSKVGWPRIPCTAQPMQHTCGHAARAHWKSRPRRILEARRIPSRMIA